MKRNCGAEMTVLIVVDFVGLGVEHVPERPTVFCGSESRNAPQVARRHDLPSLRFRANRNCQRQHCEPYIDLKVIRADFFDIEIEIAKNVHQCPLTNTPQPGAANMVLPNRKRILLVDDYEDARDLAALTLAEYALVTASDFNEGLRLARRGGFDLYILDNWLPGKSGVELCRAIREFDPDTPILFYSAAAYERDKNEALQAGAQVYLTKPSVPGELRQAVAQVISAPRETDS
jgi:CheY-like chemotaxis protein